MSSLSRLVLAALVAGFSVVSFNAFADNSNQVAQAAASSNPAAAAASAPAHHAAKAAHHKAAPININSADAAALSKIKGIGAKKAEAIVAYRAKNGQFQSITDLKNVTNAKGKALFSEKSLEKLEKRLTV